MRPPIVRSGNIDLSPGGSGIVVALPFSQIGDAEVYLAGFGAEMSPESNEDFVTFRLRSSGQLVPGYEGMRTLMGTLAQPQMFDPPIPLGRGAVPDVYGEVTSGASGTSSLAGKLILKIVPPGENHKES